jgi:hypothetical protein
MDQLKITMESRDPKKKTNAQTKAPMMTTMNLDLVFFYNKYTSKPKMSLWGGEGRRWE